MKKSFDFKSAEEQLKSFWNDISLASKMRLANKGNKPFYFLDGPPYTSGKVHIGTAWNKSMKDLVVRYKRMRGFDVWDRAGYDMHGLPNEHATMKKLNLKSKDEIIAFGLDKFISECKKNSLENLKLMNDDFLSLGISLDFTNAYQTMSDEWIQSVWWLVKKAYSEGRLYKGLRPMAWDPVHETACAKHELFYREVEDNSIYVKFRRTDTDGAGDEYFIVWTTTPWTIPFNLMIMVNPDIDYCRVRVGDELWIVACELVDEVLSYAGVKGEVVSSFSGSELVGAKYEHFFSDIIDYDDNPKVHTVVPSTEYVTTQSGTGLVHAAPGCGPEDYEVGVREGVPAFNLLDEKGVFPEGMGPISGLVAREHDDKFIDLIRGQNALVAVRPYLHDYPFAERSKAPVIYKTTPQWFFKVSDLKDQMIRQNNAVNWVPKAGYNSFNNWLENLRDNSITKQRFWGTPFPVWVCTTDPDDIIVVGSRDELEFLSGVRVPELHKPWIDDVVIKKDGKLYKRLPDVIDVWVDAGIASYACLLFPHKKEFFDRLFPADFIIEGNDQVRGWFNLLMVTSTLAFSKAPFKNVYMHGMINDSKGRKMSKSLGNYIRPGEVLEQFGADATRLYLISATKAGNDLSYNHEDCRNKHKNLMIYWNIHRYLLDMVDVAGVKKDVDTSSLTIEDKYILSFYNQSLKSAHEMMERYDIDKYPVVVETLFDKISRTYIQLIRDVVRKADAKAVSNKQAVLATVYTGAVKLLAPICPFISEAIWQNLKKPLGLFEESVHLSVIPDADTSFIDEELTDEFEQSDKIISLILSARDAIGRGVRWPLASATISGSRVREELVSLIARQTNTKKILFSDSIKLKLDISPDFRALGKDFGQKTAKIASAIKNNPSLADEFADKGYIAIHGEKIGPEHLVVKRVAPEGHHVVHDKDVTVLVDLAEDDKLLREGYVRELIRRVQELRKKEDFDKTDRIKLVLDPSLKELVSDSVALIRNVVGAVDVVFKDPSTQPAFAEFKVRDKTMRIGLSHVH